MEGNLKFIRNKNKLKNLRNKEKYTDRRARILIIRYQLGVNEKAKNKLIELCYPIIFSFLGKFSKTINTKGKLLDNRDLFNECVLTTYKCIENFNYKKKVMFSTFLWVSFIRSSLRFLDKNLLKHENKKISIDDFQELIDIDEKNICKYKKYNMKSFVADLNEELEINYEFLQVLDKTEKKVLLKRIKDEDKNNIMNDLNLDKDSFKNIIKNIENKYKEY